MKLKFKIKHLKSLLLTLLIITSSCKKFVQVDAPINQLITSTVFIDDNTATAAQTVVYDQLKSNTTMEWFTGLSSDKLINWSATPAVSRIYSNSLIAVDGNTPIAFWGDFYKYIYQENALIENLKFATKVSNGAKNQITGEALFMRAFFHFYLYNIYGNIPIVTTTDYTINTNLPRADKSSVYKQIITDLLQAKSLLNKNYVDGSSTLPTTERVRPTYWAATALLARVYLYDNDFANAELQSSEVIANTTQFQLTTLDKVFLKNNNEAIWQISPLTISTSTDEGRAFILTAPPNGSSGKSLSTQLINSFEVGDNRRNVWVGTYVAPNLKTYYFPNKYKIQTGTSDSPEYSTIFRLAEQYLIRSEARSQEGNFTGAASDLNAVRNRAGLANTIASDKASFQTAILHERQIELFTEANRWFDLKRTGKIDEVMKLVSPIKGGVWNSYQQQYPIPPTDITNSIVLTQNLGY